MSNKIQLNSASLSSSLKIVEASISNVKNSSANIKVTFTSNKMKSFNSFAKSSDSFKKQIESYASKFQMNLDALSKGITVMKETDASLSRAIDLSNKSGSSGGF